VLLVRERSMKKRIPRCVPIGSVPPPARSGSPYVPVHGARSTFPVIVDGKFVGTSDVEVQLTPYGIEPDPVVVLNTFGQLAPEFEFTATGPEK